MAINRERGRQWLKAFDFRKLFIEELGWDNFARPIVKQIDGTDYCFQAVAQKRGVAVLVSDSIPDYAIRVKLDKLIAKDHFEHLIIFSEKSHGKQVWQWVRNEKGKPKAVRSHQYSTMQSGELLFQKLDSLVFTLDEEEILTLTSVTGRLKAFDVEKVTKKFYERFKTEHSSFLSFIKGIPDKQVEAWYASVMINRLMFLYFIQEKGFLDGDKDYLRNKLTEIHKKSPDTYYKEFLCPLFFQGFARKKAERSAATNKLLGEIPYLNGGLFQKHQIEEQHGKTIVITDKAFQKLFDFFKEYNWHLDEREDRNDNEINPDVLGYIFEKYINQKQMGAYYTKEDITEYIAQNTIIPFLLDEARKGCAVAFAPEGSVWRLLQDDPDRYIYDAMKKGADLALPAEIAAGVTDVGQRTRWNRKAPEEFALPTEIWRETIDRLQRYRDIKAKLAAGDVRQVNDLVTLNLNIRRFTEDVILDCEGPELLRALWKAIEKVSVLDPTCGSGAFLFAALNILKPLYTACLIQMQAFVNDMEAAGPHHAKKFEDFKKTLAESDRHPKQDYFILKAIIVNNLFGVDIMEEAVEICKLRLFLKLVAQVESQDSIEPLPDIDFNIRVGNTLVGYEHLEDILSVRGIRTDEENEVLAKIEDKALILDAKVRCFRLQQTELNGTVTADDKIELHRLLSELDDELNIYLSGEYGIKKSTIEKWKQSHKPFHWLCDFHQTVAGGGFDVIIGNPPFVEYTKVRNQYSIKKLQTEKCGNLYAFVTERASHLLNEHGRLGFIVPIAAISVAETGSLRIFLKKCFPRIWLSNYAIRPAKLFEGVEQRLTLMLCDKNKCAQAQIFSTKYNQWYVDERPYLFNKLSYCNVTNITTGDCIPKVGDETLSSIVRKVQSRQGLFVGQSLVRNSSQQLFFHRTPGYWIRIMDFEPYFQSPTATRSIHHIRELHVRSISEAKCIGAAISSSLYFTWFFSIGNCRNLTLDDVKLFPFAGMEPEGAASIEALFTELMEDFQHNSVINHRGDTAFQEFDWAKSKPIIDRIDHLLGPHYGLSDEEVDYVINYDLKIRLGRDNDVVEVDDEG
jgi:type I restriction-modification system DNA methylase subunit